MTQRAKSDGAAAMATWSIEGLEVLSVLHEILAKKNMQRTRFNSLQMSLLNQFSPPL